jgi:hypothetical protein
MVMERLVLRPDLFLETLAMRFSRSRRVDGLWVGSWFWDKRKDLTGLDRIEEALGLIKRHDPLRYDRLRRDLERIWVTPLPGNWGEYRDALRMCALDERYVLAKGTRPEQIASTIVHEATHARLLRCGIGYETSLRARVEAVCFRRQRAFATRLPTGGPTQEDAERRLTGYPVEFWSDASLRQRHDQGAADALRYLGRSEFFIRTAFRARDLVWRLRTFARHLKHPFHTR